MSPEIPGVRQSVTSSRSPVDHAHAPRDAVLTEMPTFEVTLRPSFIEALRQVAPRRKRSPLRYAVVIACAVAALAATPSVRGGVGVKARWLAMYGRPSAPAGSRELAPARRDDAPPVAPAASSAAPIPTATLAASATPTPATSATPATPATSAPRPRAETKARPRRASPR